MRHLLISILFIGNIHSYSQNEDLLKLIKESEAKNRTVLIKEDSLFIDSIISEIKTMNCQSINNIFSSHRYSNAIVFEMTNRLINIDTLCYRIILNNIAYFDEDPLSIRPNDIINYPVAKSIFSNNSSMNKLAAYLIHSTYLSGCSRIQEFTENAKASLKRILEKFEFNLESISNDCCKRNNIIQILNK